LTARGEREEARSAREARRRKWWREMFVRAAAASSGEFQEFRRRWTDA
jgi:hypothetical protein